MSESVVFILVVVPCVFLDLETYCTDLIMTENDNNYRMYVCQETVINSY